MTAEVIIATDETTLIIENNEPSVITTSETETILLVEETSIVVMEVAEQGPPGAAAFISADADNRLRYGADTGLYVPDDLTPDPLAYYILAKA